MTRYIFGQPRWGNPRTPIVIPSTKQGFFGANIHIKYGNGEVNNPPVRNYPTNQTAQSYVNKALDLGIKWYRTNVSTAANIVNERPYFTLMRANGIEPFIVIDQGISLSNSYATNYSQGLALGQAIGQAAAGYALYFETSNEQDYPCRSDEQGQTGYRSGLDGSQRTDFYQPALNAFFGWNTGVADGLRQFIPDAKIGYATGAGFGCYIVGEMWQKGLDTSGNVVRAPVQVDFQGVHWYWSMGDPRTATPNGGTTLNVMQEVWRRMGVPSFITEWGSSPKDTSFIDATQASQLSTRCATYWNNRVADHTAGAFFYGMFPNPEAADDPVSPNWGLVVTDGNTIKPSYTAFKNFIAS
ncbi:hypothetical protein [Caballeronia grimmiae]|uniref:hypothetical protein n=1 Tax=Caballeronia grimmiae TaxID=1071679 RepID=UPI0038B902D8